MISVEIVVTFTPTRANNVCVQVTRMIDDFRKHNTRELKELAMANKASIGYGERCRRGDQPRLELFLNLLALPHLPWPLCRVFC